MLYAVRYRYVDLGGEEHIRLDGYSFGRDLLADVGEGDYGNPCFCAYSSRKSALEIKRYLDGMLGDMKRRKACRKVWKAKVVEVGKSEIPPENLETAVENAAARYYFSLCL